MRGQILVLVVFLASLHVVFANTEWEVYGGSVEHQGWDTSFAPNYSLYSTIGLVSSSSLSASDSIESSLIIKNNIAYVNGINGLYVRNLATGEVTSIPYTYGFVTFSPASTPVIVNDKYCYIDKFSIYCRYLANNSLAWQYTITDAEVSFGESSLVFANNRIWVGARSTDRIMVSAFLYAFGENGNLLYKIAPPDFVFPNGVREKAEKIFTPVVSGGKAIVAVNYAVQGQSSRIVAYYENNGSLAWDKFLDLGEGVLTLNVPSVKNEKLFITVMDIAGVDQNDDILALNKNDGSLVWQAEINNADQRLANVMPVVYADKIIVPSTDGVTSYVYAFNESNGNLLWTSGVITGDIQSSLSVADSIILFGTNDNSAIYGLSTLNGDLVWSHDPGVTPIAFTPAIVNGTVYFIDDNSNFIQMKSKNDKSGSVTVRRGQTTKFLAPEADAEIDLNGREDLITDVIGNINIINKIDENSASSGLSKLDKYVTINLDLIVLNGLDYIFIKHYYTEDELANLGLDESALKTYSFDGSKWNLVANSGVDTENNFVYANISRTDLTGGSLSLSGGATSLQQASTQAESISMVSFDLGGVGRLLDTDNDGVGDNVDNCRGRSNPGQEDRDNDGIGDACDNCVNNANGDQANNDNDASGNACDLDDDNDGRLDGNDECPLVAYDPKLDYDGDGKNDVCDGCPLLVSIAVGSNSGLTNLINLNKTLIDTRNVRADSAVTNNVLLKAGLNMVSIPIIVDGNLLDIIKSQLQGRHKTIWVYMKTDDGDKWINFNPDKPGFLQTLSDINVQQGFWIDMKEDAMLNVNGRQSLSRSVVMRQGFNLIAYQASQNNNAADVFSNVNNDIVSVFGYDNAANQYTVYVPGMSGNTLTTLEPGKAYWINANKDISWVFESNAYRTTSGYLDLAIALPSRETLIDMMINTGGSPRDDGVITLWQDGSCDLRDKKNLAYDSKLCNQADARLNDFRDLLAQQNGLDVSNKAYEWYTSCLDSFR